MKQNNTHDIVEKVALYTIVPKWTNMVLTTFILTAFLIGVPGNVLVILVQIRNAKKNVTDWFVTFLAVSDIVSLLVCVPPITLMYTGNWAKYGFDAWCKFHLFILHSNAMFSTLLIVNTGIDRYIKTMNKKNYTQRKALYSTMGTLLASACIESPNLFTSKNNAAGDCIFDSGFQNVQIVLHTILLTVVILSLCATTFIYTRIILIIKRSMKVAPSATLGVMTPYRPSIVNRQRIKALRTTKIMGLVTLIVMVSAWLPTIGAVFLSSTKNTAKTQTRNIFISFLVRLYFLNNFINPLFYLYMHRTFRENAMSVLRDIWRAPRCK